MKMQKSDIILTAAVTAVCAVSCAVTRSAAANAQGIGVTAAAYAAQEVPGSGSLPQTEWREENGTTGFVEWKSSDSSSEELRLDRPPTKRTYFRSDKLDLGGATISGCGFDHEPLADHMDMVDLGDFDVTRKGVYWITVHGETNDVGFYLYVTGGDSTSNCELDLEMVSFPDKTVYRIGEELDLTGAVFTSNYEYQDEKVTDHMDMVEAWDFDNTKPGQYRIRICDYKIARSCGFYVTVVDDDAEITTVTSQPVTDSDETATTTTTTTTATRPSGTVIEYENLYIKRMPNKLLYQTGEELDVTGGVFEGNGHITGAEDIYYDWFSADMATHLSMIDSTEFDSTKPGVYTVYIKGKKEVTSFTVQVIPKVTEGSGDANGDGRRTVADAILMARVNAEDPTAEISKTGKQSADLDGVNGLTSEDLTLILKILAGLLG